MQGFVASTLLLAFLIDLTLHQTKLRFEPFTLSEATITGSASFNLLVIVGSGAEGER